MFRPAAPTVGVSVIPGTCQTRLVTAGQQLRVKLHGSCTREDDLDRTRPSPGSAATGFGGGVWAGPGMVTRQRRFTGQTEPSRV